MFVGAVALNTLLYDYFEVDVCQLLAQLHLQGNAEKQEEKREPVLPSLTLEGVAENIKAGKCRKIIVMSGAGISTAAGIPDFRSPGSGLYANLEKYNLPSPQSIFEINFFLENPKPFFVLAKELYPSNFQPTLSHYFIRLLAEHGLLLRSYTQNIDTLERIANIPADLIVEAHGAFHTAHCTSCQREYSHEWVKDLVFADEIPTCEDCQSYVKPDIVFFGEGLPERFHRLAMKDFGECDLLIVMGTSLAVQPFASLTSRVPASCPRLLINREKVGESDPIMALMGLGSGFQFDSTQNNRDVFFGGDCDKGCQELARLLGWEDELLALMATERAKLPQTVTPTGSCAAAVHDASETSEDDKSSDGKTAPATNGDKEDTAKAAAADSKDNSQSAPGTSKSQETGDGDKAMSSTTSESQGTGDENKAMSSTTSESQGTGDEDKAISSTTTESQGTGDEDKAMSSTTSESQGTSDEDKAMSSTTSESQGTGDEDKAISSTKNTNNGQS